MKLKVGLLIDQEYESKYVYDLVNWALGQDDIEISHLIKQSLPQKDFTKNVIVKVIKFVKIRGIYSLISYLFFQALNFIEFQFLKRNLKYKNHFKLFNLSEHIKNTLIVTPQISKSGFVYKFSDEDVQKIKNANFDLIIRFGSGILHGNILHSSKFGILSFHHGDNTINRGGPPGFWEVYLKQATTGFTIQILNEELDGGHVLAKGRIPTRLYYLLNQASLYEVSNVYLKQVIKKIAIDNKLPKIENKLPYYNHLYKSPNLFVTITYIINTLTFILKRLFYKLLKYDYVWNVGFVSKKWNELSFWKSKKLERSKGVFLADPFLLNVNDNIYCFVEEYMYKNKKGQITVYDLKPKVPLRLGVALAESFHLSFPNIFKYEDEFYMCPESSENKDIRLYKCIDMPLKWEFFKVIKQNISAVDSIIFSKNNLWWLFTNIDTNHNGDHHTELHIFYSNSPLTDSWLPHTANPVYIDSNLARNGGLIEEDGKIYRVCQKIGFGHYGRNICINEIINLTPNTFEEKLICDVYPNFFPKISGIHHLHSIGGKTVFDFAQWQRI